MRAIDFSSVTSMYGSVHCASQVVKRAPRGGVLRAMAGGGGGSGLSPIVGGGGSGGMGGGGHGGGAAAARGGGGAVQGGMSAAFRGAVASPPAPAPGGPAANDRLAHFAPCSSMRLTDRASHTRRTLHPLTDAVVLSSSLILFLSLAPRTVARATGPP